jgi:hypothetical protein
MGNIHGNSFFSVRQGERMVPAFFIPFPGKNGFPFDFFAAEMYI